MINNICEEISIHTGIDTKLINKFIDRKKDFYKYKKIMKKGGGSRKIYLPTPELKCAQHFLIEKFLSKCKINRFALAYSKGSSCVTNALLHAKNKHFLFVDVHNFFDSIDYDILLNIISNDLSTLMPNTEIEKILNICSRKKKFVQGCPSSPIISNIYLYSFDNAISTIVDSLPNGVYTRYSDDIVISSSESIPCEILDEVKKQLSTYKLSLNAKKTHYSSNMQNVSVTGIRIKDDGSVSLSTKFKKRLKSSIFNKLKYGVNSKEKANVLIGYLCYLKMVDIKYYNFINMKFSSNDTLAIDRLKQFIK